MYRFWVSEDVFLLLKVALSVLFGRETCLHVVKDLSRWVCVRLTNNSSKCMSVWRHLEQLFAEIGLKSYFQVHAGSIQVVYKSCV